MYEKLMDKTIQCDLCGEKNPEGEIYKSDDMIYLCPECLRKIEAVPQSVRESMERFLLGNVL
ncbi:MAG: hypothetical protein MUC41_05375 [Syntrophobacteraceae bacterium]|jgi:DNA-directed RNA polymerase subunit RPC12/RpoP|nr:hypothetical protein [Syntrophobacteraceae bacterium]